jgi:hypothetical protein
MTTFQDTWPRAQVSRKVDKKSQTFYNKLIVGRGLGEKPVHCHFAPDKYDFFIFCTKLIRDK